MSTAASNLPRASGERAATPLRFVTAASLFDGHDAAINIMRRLIQAQGVEVVHLGHNRSVDDIVRAAIQDGEARLGAAGRLLIRKSGTEPLIRVMGEGEDEGVVREVVDAICAEVEAA